MLSERDLCGKKKFIPRVAGYIKHYYHQMLDLPDSAPKVARGVALGLSFDFLPIPFISIPLSYLIARLIRCNPVAAVATVVSFKLAVPFFYTLNVMTGKALLGDVPGPALTIAGDTMVSSLLSGIIALGYPFLLGSVVNATVVAMLVYFPLKHLLVRRRRADV